MDKETKDFLLNGIRACIADLNTSERALNMVRENLENNELCLDEYSVTHLAIENIKLVRHALTKIEVEYL